MKCPSCNKEMESVSIFGVCPIWSYVLGEDGKYVETNFCEEDVAQITTCGECGKDLPEKEAEEFYALVKDV